MKCLGYRHPIHPDGGNCSLYLANRTLSRTNHENIAGAALTVFTQRVIHHASLEVQGRRTAAINIVSVCAAQVLENLGKFIQAYTPAVTAAVSIDYDENEMVGRFPLNLVSPSSDAEQHKQLPQNDLSPLILTKYY